MIPIVGNTYGGLGTVGTDFLARVSAAKLARRGCDRQEMRDLAEIAEVLVVYGTACNVLRAYTESDGYRVEVP